ncbi:MAG: hypothetical protein M3384_04020 [Acidobacteriota bacterium]|nr:hypothetical protein [Acidobacteriota bacterium]
MRKTILILICLLFLSQAALAQEKNNYDKFLDEAAKGFGADAEKLNKQFKLAEYDRWDADQDTGKLIFSDGKGKPKVIASFQIAGSYSTYSNTWKWSWANDTIDAAMKREMNKIKEFGENNRFRELSTPQWKCAEDYAWTMTAVAGQLTKAKGAYRGQIPDGFVYLLITDIKWADAK